MKLFVLAIVFSLVCLGAALAPGQQEPPPQAVTLNKPLSLEKDKPVYMLTYFRQRYPTRIEIDAKNNTIEVPLPNPMLINKLHIALSTDGRHWDALKRQQTGMGPTCPGSFCA